MAATITVRDETTSGATTHRVTLEFPSELITVRELIRERIYQEVQDYNRRADGAFRGLVQPGGRAAGIPSPGKFHEVDWKAQFESACEAFCQMRVLVLVGDRQATSLDEQIELSSGTEVVFLKLVPLVGG